MPLDAPAEEQFGPYLVYERLGIGGMATVHRALEQGSEGFERTVALKRLLPHLAEDASFIKSFVREAKLASILNHVNIVQIYELGRVGTEYFISMEYIDGRDLRRVLRHARKVTGPPPINITVGLMLQLCDALDYAHNKVDEEGHPLGLVHRDISPSNLIITNAGHLKIIDFGIAKAQSTHLRTHTGRVKGKLAYMAPEAVSGSRDLDARSDIWATGVIIHELLTARPLFASKNEYQTLIKVQRGDIMPPSTFNQACPPDLDALVFRALERDPDQRFPSAAELREELLDLKKKHSLSTGYRDIAKWLEWAFALEVPTGFSGHTDSVVISIETGHRARTPVPPISKEEEEAVETVWGAGGQESEVGPVVLEDVPDVSGKVRQKRDTEDDRSGSVDDIPTPLPSHGTMPSIYGTDPNVVVDATDPRLPSRALDPALARGTDPPFGPGTDQLRAQRTTTGQQQLNKAAARPQVPMPGRSPTGPLPTLRSPTGPIPVMRTPTGPVQVRAATGASPQVPRPAPVSQPPLQTKSGPIKQARAETNQLAPVPREKRSTDQGIQPAKPSDRIPALKPAGKSGPIPVDAPQLSDRLAAQRARDESASHMERASVTDLDMALTNPYGRPAPDDGRFDSESDAMPTLAESHAPVSDEPTTQRGYSPPPSSLGEDPPTQPSVQPVSDGPNVPVVRFAKSPTMPPAGSSSMASSSHPPPHYSSPYAASPPAGHSGPYPAPHPAGHHSSPYPATAEDRVVATKPGFVPAKAATALRSVEEPARSRRISDGPAIGASIAARAGKSNRTWVWILLALVVAGGIVTAAVVFTSPTKPVQQAPREQPAPPAPPAPPPKTVGTIKFVTEPVSAEIRIAGQVVHTGSPWAIELPAGAHQIEIHNAGYKSWLTTVDLSANETNTLRVVLEPLGKNAAPAPATVKITTEPPGLEVLIDGKQLPEKTPIKWTLRVGPHTLAVRQNGAVVWQQAITAEASSNYEFHPSLTEAKQRAPAPGDAPKPAEPAPAPAGDKQDPSPGWIKPGSNAATTAPPQPVAAVVAPTPQPPVAALTQPPKPVAPSLPKGPVIVPPGAVTKLAGEPPSIDHFRNVELPASLAAKVCIDETGKVTSADMVTKVERRVAVDLTDALRKWRYAPYLQKGAAIGACFVVPFRLK